MCLRVVREKLIMNQTDGKGLLPEKAYDAFNPELAEQRRKASELTLKFNTTGDMSFLEELFERKLDDVKISAPSIAIMVETKFNLVKTSLLISTVHFNPLVVSNSETMSLSALMCDFTQPFTLSTRKKEHQAKPQSDL